MTTSNDLALARGTQRRLKHEERLMVKYVALHKQANLEAMRVAKVARDEIWNQLLWTDELLMKRQKQGRLTQRQEDAVCREFDYLIDEMGYQTASAFRELMSVIATFPGAASLNRLEARLDTAYLLASGY